MQMLLMLQLLAYDLRYWTDQMIMINKFRNDLLIDTVY